MRKGRNRGERGVPIVEWGTATQDRRPLAQKVADIVVGLLARTGVGAPGPEGEPGEDGSPGPPGPPGPAGAAGAPGPAGTGVPPPGTEGEPGEDGAIGPPGPQGSQGVQGNQGIAGPPGFQGDEGDEGPAGPPGPVGPAGSTGATGAQGLQGFIGPPGEDAYAEDPMVIPGPQGPAGAGSGGAFTAFTQDLGAAARSGTFDITGLSGLTAGKVVQVVQTAAVISAKGDARDEFEMDAIVATGYVVDAATIRVFWFSANGSVVVGMYAFAYQVSG
ncbi:MAG TPA: hypothetical protein VGR82_17610 [Methylomirabilota bacterium]|jgi:hypothetical protein|nr:hypothetical protein [Methylomirabilota bacterium]